MRPEIVFVLPATSLHGGNRIVFELAEGLAERGYRPRLVSPDPPPSWHPLRVPYEQRDVYAPGGVPAADVAIGTFWPTVGPACGSGSGYAFHLCQGFEGVHREYGAILDQIDAAYRLPVPKLLVSRHLEAVLAERYGCRCHWIGQFVDHRLFRPGPFRAEAAPLRVGVVGPFGVRSKGIPEALTGLALARRAGHALEVHRASADPLSPAEEALGVTDRFEHHLPTARMPAFYHRLDALLFSSHDEEGFPLPPLEAMASGVPVALTAIRPFAAFPDEAVIRYPPGDPEAVVRVIAALADPERRRALRQAGLSTAAGYTRESVLDRLEAAFRAEGL